VAWGESPGSSQAYFWLDGTRQKENGFISKLVKFIFCRSLIGRLFVLFGKRTEAVDIDNIGW